MKADAIIFDKDGTLLDFEAFWVTVTEKALADVLAHFKKPDVPVGEILELLGVRDGVADTDGILCKGTYAQMCQIVYGVLQKYGSTASLEEVEATVTEAYNKNSSCGKIKASCPNLVELLTHLKSRNKKLAVVTTDNKEITHKCLETLGIEKLFDKIYTDDGNTPTKPDPYCATDFCKSNAIKPENTVMVGDTVTDVEFARNAGISVVIIAENDTAKSAMAPLADAVIPTLSALSDIIE